MWILRFRYQYEPHIVVRPSVCLSVCLCVGSHGCERTDYSLLGCDVVYLLYMSNAVSDDLSASFFMIEK
jgi:hypothetical protein